MEEFLIEITFYDQGLHPRVGALEEKYLRGRTYVPREILLKYSYVLLPEKR